MEGQSVETGILYHPIEAAEKVGTIFLIIIVPHSMKRNEILLIVTKNDK